MHIHVYANMDNDKSLFLHMEASCTLHNTRKAARAVTEAYETVLVPSGIHATQFPLLAAIRAQGPVSMTALAQGLQTDRTTLTRTLKPLQEQGWVEIAPGKDRRVQEVRLTPAGAAALEQAIPLWKQAQGQMQRHMGQAHWEELLRHLHTLTALKE